MDRVIESWEISRLQLQNIRGFRELTLNVREAAGKARKRTLIVGKNGTGKSTVLRAIALGLADETDASRLISEPIGGFLTRRYTSGRIEVDLVETDTHLTGIKLQKRIQRASTDRESISWT